MSRRRFTDSAGVTCEYTPIEELKPDDVVIIGWRTTVVHVEIDEVHDQARVVWSWGGRESVDQWCPLGTELPVEVTDERETCVFCNEKRDPSEFEDGLRCVYCQEEDEAKEDNTDGR